MSLSSMNAARLLTVFSLLGSAALIFALFLGWWWYDSQLALAQAADSFMDVFTASVLTLAVVVGSRPSDDDHPFGHTRAEPIAGLITAVMAGVIAVEVGRNAIAALLTGEFMRPDLLLVAAFSTKIVFKGIVYGLARRLAGTRTQPVLHALAVDARNDMLICSVAVGGYFAAAYGWTALDAWLTLPLSGWIMWSGISLARANIRLLMGEAPPAEKQDALRGIAAGIQGVLGVRQLRAQYMGTQIQVEVDILVAPSLTVKEAHDIGEKVSQALEREDDIAHAAVHIDIE